METEFGTALIGPAGEVSEVLGIKPEPNEKDKQYTEAFHGMIDSANKFVKAVRESLNE